MSLQNGIGIKQLIQLLPEGVAAPFAWLGGSGHGFEHAAQIFEGLTVLRPALANDLLAACKNIKVKRLFLFLTNHFDYPWTKRLNTSELDLGHGNRQVVKGGRLDKQYHITIPENFGAKQV